MKTIFNNRKERNFYLGSLPMKELKRLKKQYEDFSFDTKRIPYAQWILDGVNEEIGNRKSRKDV